MWRIFIEMGETDGVVLHPAIRGSIHSCERKVAINERKGKHARKETRSIRESAFSRNEGEASQF